MLELKRKIYKKSSLNEYLTDPVNIDALEKGLRDVVEGKISYINPENLWKDIN